MAIKNSVLRESTALLRGFCKTSVLQKHVFPAALFFLSAFLQAQTTGGYFSELRFIQRLAWAADEYVLRYEVLVEREDRGTYRRLLQEFTETFFIEISLAPGKYRYRVIPYDYLNRPREGTEWVDIEVRAAISPELDDVRPDIFFPEENAVHVLNITGKNLESGAGFFLRSPGLTPIVPFRVNIFSDGTEASLHFNNEQLIPGVYELLVRNPSGLETRGGVITIARPEPEPESEPEPEEQPVDLVEDNKPFTVGLSVAWMPLLPVYGGNNSIFLIGAAVRVNAVYFETDLFNAGLEIAASWHDRTERTATMQFDLMTQISFHEMALRFRFGIGTVLTDIFYVHANIGASFLWFVQKKYYFEVGLDHVHLLMPPTGFLRPWYGLGWRF
jgi:hypothetical protein